MARAAPVLARARRTHGRAPAAGIPARVERLLGADGGGQWLRVRLRGADQPRARGRGAAALPGRIQALARARYAVLDPLARGALRRRRDDRAAPLRVGAA